MTLRLRIAFASCLAALVSIGVTGALLVADLRAGSAEHIRRDAPPRTRSSNMVQAVAPPLLAPSRVTRWMLLGAVLVAQVAAAAPDQTISLALGLPAAELGWQVRASDRPAFGARLAWDQLNREESLSLSAVGITAPAWLDLAFERFTLSLEAAPGARHFAGSFRDASCGCIVDTSPAYALQMPVTASLRVPLSEVAGLTLYSTLGSDLLLSGGLLVSPQAGVAMDATVSPMVSLGLMARAGRVLVLNNVDTAVLGGRRAITMPLALLLTIAVRL